MTDLLTDEEIESLRATMKAASASIRSEFARLKECGRMPKGPKGWKRPADAIGLAVMVGRIATGEITDTPWDDGKDKAAQELGRKDGKARAEGMTPERRAEIAKKAAAARWKD